MSDATSTGNEEFVTLGEKIKQLTSKPDNDTLLALYAHYKQATKGDNDTDAPGMFDLTGKAKWNAWNELRGMSKEQAQERYIQIAKATISSHS
ncbi:acyl-CoA-binding protein [Streptomyces roseochromogenus]|uniref:ACB domain-containing protein n=1 Tax=Streptomyces roseochromogenus subsp. oscitans DS 12.976 TaxID=1352936 RepID=V6L5C8_STRRC|nr:acyl-CoA-binding protein [Streptomyces roseochromogenus]EST36429.1 hypothetical protein M878_02275 [Streptomyces roseochromogenus subsp. oscitans DS 12.976]